MGSTRSRLNFAWHEQAETVRLLDNQELLAHKTLLKALANNMCMRLIRLDHSTFKLV